MNEMLKAMAQDLGTIKQTTAEIHELMTTGVVPEETDPEEEKENKVFGVGQLPFNFFFVPQDCADNRVEVSPRHHGSRSVDQLRRHRH